MQHITWLHVWIYYWFPFPLWPFFAHSHCLRNNSTRKIFSQLSVVLYHECFAFPGLPGAQTCRTTLPCQSSYCWEFLTLEGWRNCYLPCFWRSISSLYWETCSSSSPFWFLPTSTPPCISSWATCQCVTYFSLQWVPPKWCSTYWGKAGPSLTRAVPPSSSFTTFWVVPSVSCTLWWPMTALWLFVTLCDTWLSWTQRVSHLYSGLLAGWLSTWKYPHVSCL